MVPSLAVLRCWYESTFTHSGASIYPITVPAYMVLVLLLPWYDGNNRRAISWPLMLSAPLPIKAYGNRPAEMSELPPWCSWKDWIWLGCENTTAANRKAEAFRHCFPGWPPQHLLVFAAQVAFICIDILRASRMCLLHRLRGALPFIPSSWESLLVSQA